MWFTVCLVSLLCGCFTVFTFVVYPDRRKFPSILILHMTVATMIGAFSGLFCTYAQLPLAAAYTYMHRRRSAGVVC